MRVHIKNIYLYPGYSLQHRKKCKLKLLVKQQAFKILLRQEEQKFQHFSYFRNCKTIYQLNTNRVTSIPISVGSIWEKLCLGAAIEGIICSELTGTAEAGHLLHRSLQHSQTGYSHLVKQMVTQWLTIYFRRYFKAIVILMYQFT